MTQKEKLIDRILSVPSDITYDEVKRLFAIFDFVESNKGATSGSRVKFEGPNGASYVMHKPHPSKIVKKCEIRQLVAYLESKGFIEKHKIK